MARVDRGLILGFALAVALSGIVGVLGWTNALGNGLGLPCGEEPSRTMRITAPLRQRTETAPTYRLARPSLTDADALRLAEALGIEAVPRETPTGWETPEEFPQLAIQRLALGWAISGNASDNVAEMLAAEQAVPDSLEAASAIARRLLERMGVSTTGWNVAAGDIPDDAYPYRTVTLAPVIDGIALDGVADPNWSVDVRDDGLVGSVEGILFDLVPGPIAPLAPPSRVAEQLFEPDSQFATEQLGFQPISEDGTRAVVDAVRVPPPDKIDCSGGFVAPIHGRVAFDGRVLSDPPQPYEPIRRVEIEVTGVDLALAVVVLDRRAETVALVPGYAFKLTTRLGPEPAPTRSLATELAVEAAPGLIEAISSA